MLETMGANQSEIDLKAEQNKTTEDLHELCNLFNLDAQKDPSVMEFINQINKETQAEAMNLLTDINSVEVAPIDKELAHSLSLAQYNNAIGNLNSLFEEQQNQMA